jgi:hypothetical protein
MLCLASVHYTTTQRQRLQYGSPETRGICDLPRSSAGSAIPVPSFFFPIAAAHDIMTAQQSLYLRLKAVPPKAAHGHDIMTKSWTWRRLGPRHWANRVYRIQHVHGRKMRLSGLYNLPTATAFRDDSLPGNARKRNEDKTTFKERRSFRMKNCKKDYSMVSAIDRVPSALHCSPDSRFQFSE